MFVVYLGVVAAITIVPTQFTRFHGLDSNHINLVPFRNSFRCYRYALDARSGLRSFCLTNLIGNIALFLPLGILLPLVSDRFRSFKRVLLVGFCLSLTIEVIQFVSRFFGIPRTVDIDDVILNTLGGCLGFALYKFLIAKVKAVGRKQ